MAKDIYKNQKKNEEKAIKKELEDIGLSTGGYRGNPNIKGPGEVINYTKEHIEELKKCMNDVVYFGEHYFTIVNLDRGKEKIKLYDYQKQMLRHMQDNKFAMVLSSRQIGKTTVASIFLLWYTIFNSDKTVGILANKNRTAQMILSRIQLAYGLLPKWIQPGIKEGGYNKQSMEFENGSRMFSASTSSSSVRGEAVNCVTGDTMITIVDDYDRVWCIPIEKLDSSKYKKSYTEEDTMKKYYIVYKITNLVNNKEYIGYHSTNNLDDGYMGSGKLIIKAIEKYGKENFKKEILFVYDNKEEAELKEAELVNDEYRKREDTYNITIGGNVTSLPGKLNGQYGSKQSEQFKEGHKKWFENWDHNWKKSDDVIIDGKRYNSYQKALSELNVTIKQLDYLLLKNGNGYINKELQEKHIEKCKQRELKREEWLENTSKRFKGIPKSEDQKQKISLSQKGKSKPWTAEKVNKNPEKIRKTAEKHRGMKRSEEAKKNISEAIKNFVWCYDWVTLDCKRCKLENVPDGWQLGRLGFKENRIYGSFN